MGTVCPGQTWSGAAAEYLIGFVGNDVVKLFYSAARRQQAREAINAYHRRRRLGHVLLCGARRKRDGEPCCNVAMANGRCRAHGGRTGSREAWHVMQLPNGDAPDFEPRLERKIDDHARAKKKRAARVAAMSPDERVRHEEWQKSHRPGPPGPRDQARQRKKSDRDAMALLAKERPEADDPERKAIARQIAELRALRAKLETKRDG